MVPVLCLESVKLMAQADEEMVVAVFFDVEMAYDMMWNEGLLIQLDNMGVGGRVFNWIKDFIFGPSIQVRVGSSMLESYEVGLPGGAVGAVLQRQLCHQSPWVRAQALS